MGGAGMKACFDIFEWVYISFHETLSFLLYLKRNGFVFTPTESQLSITSTNLLFLLWHKNFFFAF